MAAQGCRGSHRLSLLHQGGFPCMHGTQRPMVAPGFFGRNNCIGMGHKCGRRREFLTSCLLTSRPQGRATHGWSGALAHGRWKIVGCDVAVKPKGHDCDMKLGGHSRNSWQRDRRLVPLLCTCKHRAGRWLMGLPMAAIPGRLALTV